MTRASREELCGPIPYPPAHAPLASRRLSTHLTEEEMLGVSQIGWCNMAPNSEAQRGSVCRPRQGLPLLTHRLWEPADPRSKGLGEGPHQRLPC